MYKVIGKLMANNYAWKEATTELMFWFEGL